MAITFTAAGAAKSVASGNITTLAIPAGFAADDIHVVVVNAADNVSITLPAGWTKKIETNSGVFERLTVGWRRAVGGDSTFTVTHAAGDTATARVFGYRGCITTGDPFEDAQATATAGSKTVTAPDLTIVNANDMILFCCGSAVSGDTSNGMSTASYSGTNPTFTERGDTNSGTGVSSSEISVADGIRTVASGPGSRTAAITTAFAAGLVNNVGTQLALIEAGGGGGAVAAKNLAALGVG